MSIGRTRSVQPSATTMNIARTIPPGLPQSKASLMTRQRFHLRNVCSAVGGFDSSSNFSWADDLWVIERDDDGK